MSALKIGEEEYVDLDNPIQGLVLIKVILKQHFGPLWTNFNPQCPLCNKPLEDFAKHMHRPVGTCSNTTCGAEIHAYDYFGKIMDVIRLIEEEFGPVEEIAKKKLALVEPEQKKKKLKKKQTSKKPKVEPVVNKEEASETELIFEY
jgi:hypothetical protein